MSFEDLFFSRQSNWEKLMGEAMTALREALPEGAYAGGDASTLPPLPEGPVLPPRAMTNDAVMAEFKAIVGQSVAVWHPYVSAHLHCPVLVPALAAELAISALNQSMDSFDQAPSATLVELKLADWLCRTVGMPSSAAATFTSGGTQSNYMGLLLARDAFSLRHWGHSTREKGLHPDFGKLRILCSKHAHFSIAKSAIQLGLAESSVVPVDTDSAWRIDPAALDREVVRLKAEGLIPFAIAATAGTTDFGSIDPLQPIAAIAEAHGLWLHVDAAYGGALLMSEKYRSRLAGLERADSVTIDFHKAFFQPVSCSALVLRDRACFAQINIAADYLNPEDRQDEGFPDLVNWSLQTTRRFDALKLWMSFRMVGAERFAAMIDSLVEKAVWLAETLAADPRFEPLHRPEFGCVVFRYLGDDADWLNDALPKYMFRRGEAVIGHTRIDGRPCLKLTLINPLTGEDDLIALLDKIDGAARVLLADRG